MLFGLAGSIGATGAAWADAPPQVSELVVVANRNPEPLSRIGQQVTVVTADQIRARQAVGVAELLAETPGVAMSRNGGPGGVTALRIRGAESDQTLVVVDGVRLNDASATGAGYNFANLLIGDVARIEVLRGAQSTLWGSQAIGGVVSLETAQPEGPFAGSASLEGGSAGTGYGRLALGGKADRLAWRLAGGLYRTDGVSAFRRGREADGYGNTGLSGRARLALTDAMDLDLRIVSSRGRSAFDGFPAPSFQFADDREYGKVQDLTSYSGFDLRPSPDLKLRLAYTLARTTRRNFNPDQAVTPLTFDSRGETGRWELQAVWTPSDAVTATVGAERERAFMRSAAPSAFAPAPRPLSARGVTDSLYAQVQVRPAAALSLTGGLRHDRHDAFGDHVLGQAALAWTLGDDGAVLRASFGQGLKTPSLYQLYSPYGNLALRPESAESWDLGLEGPVGPMRMSLAIFQRETRNQIDFVSCFGLVRPQCQAGGGRFGYYENIARTRAHGIEAAVQGRLGGLDLDGALTWSRAENASASDPNRGRRLARRPDVLASLAAGRTWRSGLTTSMSVRHVSDSFDNAGNTYKLKAYTLVDLRASRPLTPQTEVFARVENLMDRAYETTRDYGAPGRRALLGIRAVF